MRKRIYMLIAVVLSLSILVPMLGCQPEFLVREPEEPKEVEEVEVVEEVKEPIRIGAAYALTGPFAYDAGCQKVAIEIGLKMVNDAGGILGGRPVEIVYRDHSYIPEEAVTAVRKLIYDDKVDVVIGLEDTALIWAAAPIMHDAGMPYVEHGGNPPGWPRVEDVGHFRCGFALEQLISGLFEWASEVQGVKSMTVVGIDTTFIRDTYKYIMTHYAEEYGIQLNPIIVYPVGAPDFMPQYTKGVAEGADMLWGTNFFTSELPREIAAIHELGYEGLYVMAPWAAVEEVIAEVAVAAEGAYVPFVDYAWDPDNAEMVEFVTLYKAETGLVPHHWPVQAWLAFWTVIHGLDEAGKCPLILEEFDAGVKAAKWTSVLGYPVLWTEYGALVHHTLYIAEIQNGKFVKVVDQPCDDPWEDVYGKVLD